MVSLEDARRTGEVYPIFLHQIWYSRARFKDNRGFISPTLELFKSMNPFNRVTRKAEPILPIFALGLLLIKNIWIYRVWEKSGRPKPDFIQGSMEWKTFSFIAIIPREKKYTFFLFSEFAKFKDLYSFPLILSNISLI